MTEDDAALDALTRIWQTSVQQNTNELNARVREDTIKTNLLIAQLNHKNQARVQEHQIKAQAHAQELQIKAQERQAQLNQTFQLKMLELQEHFKVQEKWFDLESRRTLMYEQAVVQAHSKKMDQCGEYYSIGNYLQEKLRNQPAPYIIISTNAHGAMNPLKNEGLMNVPLSQITDTLRQFNGVYEVKKMLTITDTNEYFTSESDIAGFYHRELNCPCIIVYANFTTDSLVVSAYIAGMLDEQRENASFDEELIDLRPRRQVLYSIPYGNIYNMIQNAKTDGKPFEWQLRLSEFTTVLVVLWIQRYIDEYFKYLPFSVYESKTAEFINSRGEALKQQFPNLIDDFETKIKTLNSFQKSNKLAIITGGFISLKSFLLLRSEDKEFKKKYLYTVTSYQNGFFENLLPIFNSKRKVGYIDTNGNIVIPHRYDDASLMYGSRAIVRDQNEYGVIDNYGNEIFTVFYDYVSINHYDSTILTNHKGYWALYDQFHNRICSRSGIPTNETEYYYSALQSASIWYNSKQKFKEQLKDIEYINKHIKDRFDKYSFYPLKSINYSNIEDYDNYKSKIMKNKSLDNNPVNTPCDLHKFFQHGFWGFKNSHGMIVIDSVFSNVNDFTDNRCLVQFEDFAKKNEWAIIDTKGNILTKV